MEASFRELFKNADSPDFALSGDAPALQLTDNPGPGLSPELLREPFLQCGV
jgi:hypothetical protein